jgi:haloalkane dehalogenase
MDPPWRHASARLQRAPPLKAVTAFADQEDVTRFFEPIFQARVPGARGQPHATIPNAGHFLQEHAPDRLVEVVLGLPRS